MAKTVNEIAHKTGASCVVIYSRLDRLGLRDKKINNRYAFSDAEVKLIEDSLKEDRRFGKRRPFTRAELARIYEGFEKEESEKTIANAVGCTESTISKYKKRLREGKKKEFYHDYTF